MDYKHNPKETTEKSHTAISSDSINDSNKMGNQYQTLYD